MSKQRLPTSQEQIVRQSSLNRATDMVNTLVTTYPAQFEDNDTLTLRALVCEIANGFENWVQRPFEVKEEEKREYKQYAKPQAAPVVEPTPVKKTYKKVD